MGPPTPLPGAGASLSPASGGSAPAVRIVVAPPPPPPAPTPASTALEMVRYAIEAGGFLGVKVYPPVGFAPIDNVGLRPGEALSPRIDAALRALYGYCQAEDVPITTHASASNEYGLGLRNLVAPDRWRPVLDGFPALRLNLGHFGHDYGVVGSDTAQAWIHQAATLMERHAYVYADLANSPLVYDSAYAARLIGILGDLVGRFPKVKRRIMYGSDWWLARLDPEAGRAADRFRSTFGSLFKPDEVADVMGRNALRFLGLLDDDNRPRSGKAAARLRRFYAGAPHPAWLAPA
jgi:predicted TIM-barrel fold metal-dependent hydrolase